MRVAGNIVRPFVALAVGLGALVLPVAEPADAAVTRTFTGAVNNLWSVPGNWSPVGVPASGDSVVQSADIQIDVADATVASFTSPGGVGLLGTLTVTGDVTTAGYFAADLVLPAGPHVITATTSPIQADSVRGAGDIETRGDVAINFVGGLTGAVTVGSGSLTLANPTAPGGGLAIAPGATLSLVNCCRPQTDHIDSLRVMAGSAPSTLLLSDRLVGDIDLQGELVVGTNRFSGARSEPTFSVVGAISGPGSLRLGASTPFTLGSVSGTSTYSGGTTVAGIGMVAGASPLGTGPVTVSAGGQLRVEGATVTGRVSFASTPPDQFGQIKAFLDLRGEADLTGGVTVTGPHTAYIDVNAGASAVITGGATSTGPLGVRGGGFGLGPARLFLSGASSLPVVGVEGAELLVDPSVGAGAVGNVWVRNQGGSLGLFGPGIHAPGSTLYSTQGDIDLWGNDQTASALYLENARLYLGFIEDGVVDTARLTSTSLVANNTYLDFVFDASSNDQIRTGSVSLSGSVLEFYVQGVVPVGQPIRIVDNTGPNAVQGTFVNIGEGFVYQAGQQLFRLSYVGGNGNDITLTRFGGLQSTWSFDDDGVEHGGGLRGGPSVSSWGPGRLDAWISGLDRSVWHRWSQAGVGAQWENLGGISLSTPAGVSQAPGQADVFIRGNDNALWMRSYRNGWSPWTSLGGIVTDAPSVTSSSPGNLAVAIRGADGAVWIRRMVSGTWQPWTSLGGGTAYTPAITDWGDGRLDVFIRGLDGALWQRAVVNGIPSPWFSQGGLLTDAPAVAAPSPGELAVFIRGADGYLWHKSWEGAGWSDWTNLGLPIDARPGAAGVGVGELQLGVRAPDGSLVTFRATSNWYEGGAAGASVDGSTRPAGGVPGVPAGELQAAPPR